MISLDRSLLRDLGESLSVEDCYDLIEVAGVDAHNRAVINKASR